MTGDQRIAPPAIIHHVGYWVADLSPMFTHFMMC